MKEKCIIAVIFLLQCYLVHLYYYVQQKGSMNYKVLKVLLTPSIYWLMTGVKTVNVGKQCNARKEFAKTVVAQEITHCH